LQSAAYFQDAHAQETIQRLYPYLDALREYNLHLTVAFLLIGLCAIAVKLIWPLGPMLIPARAALLLIATFAFAPGLLVNGILKEHWARPRPGAVVEFGGTQAFVQWWDPRGACAGNCSFVSGEASAAFAMLAPAAVVPPPWRYAAIGAALAYGALIGLVRVAVGGHFATDIIFAGIFTAAIVWALHGWLFRWTRTRLSEEAAEGLLERAGLAIRQAVGKPLERSISVARAMTRRMIG
jgi:lipid A 4'-phosphatase